MRGGDTTGLRAYNERLIMNELLRAGALSKAEIARATGLSGQAASVIVNRLLDAGYLLKRDKVRKQVGQPSTPIAANPEGAFSLGVKIGRRSVAAVLVNLLGEVIDSRSEAHAVPIPEPTVATACRQAASLLAGLGADRSARLVGVGVAMPGELHAWSVELGLAPGALDGWRGIDVAASLHDATGLPVTLYNDGMAACAAEMIAGRAIVTRSALYIYIATFIGGGVVLDGKLYLGEQLNAGSIGSMPTCAGPDGRAGQLIEATSVIGLERAFIAAGVDPAEINAVRPTVAAERVFDKWTPNAAAALAHAVVSALGIIDFETVVVDGVLSPDWCARFTERLGGEIARFNHAGLCRAEIVTGSIGPLARVLGAAMLPLKARFSPNTDLLVRSSIDRAAGSGTAPDNARASA